MKPKDWAIALAITVLAMILNVAMSFVWVWVYSLIEPGQTEAAYTAYAQEWAPVSSIVIGGPILFAAGWLAGRGRPIAEAARMGLTIGAMYVAIDFAMVLGMGGSASPRLWLLAIASWATKLLFAWLGARAGAAKTAA